MVWWKWLTIAALEEVLFRAPIRCVFVCRTAFCSLQHPGSICLQPRIRCSLSLRIYTTPFAFCNYAYPDLVMSRLWSGRFDECLKVGPPPALRLGWSVPLRRMRMDAQRIGWRAVRLAPSPFSSMLNWDVPLQRRSPARKIRVDEQHIRQCVFEEKVSRPREAPCSQGVYFRKDTKELTKGLS